MSVVYVPSEPTVAERLYHHASAALSFLAIFFAGAVLALQMASATCERPMPEAIPGPAVETDV